jgi:VIT1/CCC1 family predicted Fe2+/Mn2+ transporter
MSAPFAGGRDAGVAPRPEHHHRDVRGGAVRAAVFGVSDGLVSNVGLILGVAGAAPGASVVRLAGLAGLIAGAISMAAGEYNSMRVQAELLRRELELERIELHRNPHVETVELAQLYQARGIDPDVARDMASQIMRDPDVALEAHAREELGIDPGSLGSPVAAGTSSFFAFSLGALAPLLPWFVADGSGAIVASLVLALVVAAIVGAGIARYAERPMPFTIGRQLLFTLVPAGITYLVGRGVGVSV